jgi:hypothetical protein
MFSPCEEVDMFNHVLILSLGTALILLIAACSDDASADESRVPVQAAQTAASPDVPAVIAMPAPLAKSSPPASLIGAPVEFSLIPVQQVFSPTLFAVGVTGRDLVLVHGSSRTGVAPRVGGMATVEGVARPLTELQTVPVGPDKTSIGALYVKAAKLDLI